MTRLAILLAILALGLGLFIWANPPARERAEAAWQDTRAYFVELYARFSLALPNLFSSGQEAASATSNSSSASSASAFSLAALFESMRDVFLSFASRLQLELS